MECLAFNGNKNAIYDKEKLKEYVICQNNDKLAYVLAYDIATFIKFKGAVAKSTVDKIVTIDLKQYKVSANNKKIVKSLVYEKLNQQFNIHPIELDISTYDDSDFIKAYKLSMDKFIK